MLQQEQPVDLNNIIAMMLMRSMLPQQPTSLQGLLQLSQLLGGMDPTTEAILQAQRHRAQQSILSSLLPERDIQAWGLNDPTKANRWNLQQALDWRNNLTAREQQYVTQQNAGRPSGHGVRGATTPSGQDTGGTGVAGDGGLLPDQVGPRWKHMSLEQLQALDPWVESQFLPGSAPGEKPQTYSGKLPSNWRDSLPADWKNLPVYGENK